MGRGLSGAALKWSRRCTVLTRALTSPLQLGLLVLSAGAVGTSLNLGKVVARGLGSGVEVAFAAELS